MTQEDKELLFKDLCARLPYGVVCEFKRSTLNVLYNKIYDNTLTINNIEYVLKDDSIVRPYLRPMSSMTEEEREELLNLLFDKEAKYFYIDEEGFIDGETLDLMKEGLNYPSFCPINIVLYTDWLNAHHFDYRGLIKKGLALEAPADMYK